MDFGLKHFRIGAASLESDKGIDGLALNRDLSIFSITGIASLLLFYVVDFWHVRGSFDSTTASCFNFESGIPIC